MTNDLNLTKGYEFSEADIIGKRVYNKAKYKIVPKRIEGYYKGLTSINNTDDIPEGLTNLYFTEERVKDIIGLSYIDSDTINFEYDDTLDQLTVDVISTGINHNDLSELQGEGDNEYYHLTLDEYNGLTDGGITILHDHPVPSISETDPEFNDWLALPPNVSIFTNDVPYLISETDPEFSAWLAVPPNISIFTNDAGYITSTTFLWQRSGIDLSPVNAGDNVILDGSLSIGIGITPSYKLHIYEDNLNTGYYSGLGPYNIHCTSILESINTITDAGIHYNIGNYVVIRNFTNTGITNTGYSVADRYEAQRINDGTANDGTLATMYGSWGLAGHQYSSLGAASTGITTTVVGLIGGIIADWGTITNGRTFLASTPRVNNGGSTGYITNQTQFYAATGAEINANNQTRYGLYIEALPNPGAFTGITEYAINLAGTGGLRDGIRFATDTNLYRSAANTLKTDDDFIANSITGINVTSGVDPGHTHTAGSITEADPDFNAWLVATPPLYAEVDTLQTVFDRGQSITIADTDNQTFSLTQNDTTNNPNAFNIVNAGDGESLNIDHNNILGVPFYIDSESNIQAMLVYSDADTIYSGLHIIKDVDSTGRGITIEQVSGGAQSLYILDASINDSIFIDKNNYGSAINIDTDCNSANPVYGINMNLNNAGAGVEYAFYFGGSEVSNSTSAVSHVQSVAVQTAAGIRYIHLHSSA